MKFTKKLICGFISLFILSSAFFVAQNANAALEDDYEEAYGLEYASQLAPGSDEADLQAVIVSVVRVLMGFLGVIAVIIILVGGFRWMTASGSEDKIAEAKNMIIAGIIGLVIIMLAWVIVGYVLRVMSDAIDNAG